MQSDPSTNIRLQNVERAVGTLTDRVGDIAKFMERLVTIEERNSFMTQKHDELKETLKEAVTALNTKVEESNTKITALKEQMIRWATGLAIVTAGASFFVPYLLKMIHFGAAQ